MSEEDQAETVEEEKAKLRSKCESPGCRGPAEAYGVSCRSW
jgi:hypothetical protein